jgi:hypothetical protein
LRETGAKSFDLECVSTAPIANNREVSALAVAKANDGVWRRADLHQPAGDWLATKTAN